MSSIGIKRDMEFYNRTISPLNNSIQQLLFYIRRKYNYTLEEAKEILKDYLKTHPLRDPVVHYNKRDYYGDFKEEVTSLTGYIKEANENRRILSPSLTAFAPHDAEKSLTGDFLIENAANRAVFKKKKFLAILEKNVLDEIFYHNRQSTMKVYNNTASGMQGSSTTVFYNPSGHAALTSTTRSVSGIGNSLSESIVGGNKYFKDADTTIEYVVACASNADIDLIKEVITEYKLTIPDPHLLFELLLDNFKYYWRDKEKEEVIVSFLKSCKDEELCAICYNNDLYALRNFNEELIHNMLTQLSEEQSNEKYENYEEDLKAFHEDSDIEILTKYICSSELKGKQVDFKAFKENDDPLLYRISRTVKNIEVVLSKYGKLIKAFLFTKILPPNLGYIKDMLRRSIVISDTDSTCCAYDEWVKWYSGNLEHTDKNLRVASCVMSLTSMAIGHGLLLLSGNIGTSKDNMTRLQMKNEFYWPTFVVTNAGKHYFALATISEGVVYPVAKREKKGVNLIASKAPANVRKLIDEIIDTINNDLLSLGVVKQKDLVDKVIAIEEEMRKDFKNGETYMFLKDSIKELATYAGDPEKCKYRDYLLWNEVFGDKYGSITPPPFVVYSIPLKTDGKSGLKEFLEHIKTKDATIAEKLKEVLAKSKRNDFKTLRVPKLIADKKGLPEEILEYVDVDYAIEKTCLGLYIILGSIGYNKKPGYLVTDMCKG